MAATAIHGTILGSPIGHARTVSSTLLGLDAQLIHVEACCTRGPAFFQLVGLAEAAVRESRVRVASALARLGFLLDEHAITVSLAPADLRKSGASLDLALALALLGALGHVPPEALRDTLLLGELSLEGELRPIRGVLPLLSGARRRNLRAAIVPTANGAEAGLVEELEVFVAPTLEALVVHLAHGAPLARATRTPFKPTLEAGHGDLAGIRGQGAARRALEIAAAGAHNLLLMGTPGSGKTLLARALPTVLPPLEWAEAFETTAVHSVAGLVDPERGVVSTRPFRAPHHSASSAALIGGGELPRPGEVSLAHHGVLFLDELPEFRRSTLEALRQPLEDGTVCVSRSRAKVWFPARPLLVGAANPCPCGWLGHPTRACRCTPSARNGYAERLSGPLVDRLDIHVVVPPVSVEALVSRVEGEPSAPVRERVRAARALQLGRHAVGSVSARTNATLTNTELDAVAPLDTASRRLLGQAVDQLGLSARGFVKVRRLARTIADLEGSPAVRTPHLAEALQLRVLDRR